MACFCGAANAIYTDEAITAIRVPDGKLSLDGKPGLLWRAVALQPGAIATIHFQDYQRLVLLQPEKVRNADPSLYVKDPVNGMIQMLVAYDNSALYFFFLVHAKTVVNPKTLCAAADFWKADAPEVYIDPNVWVDDSTSYQSYFSTDASGLTFGTSPKTIQLDKPLSDKDARVYFRNRATADKFQVPATLPVGVSAISAHHSSVDTATVIVEMKIPYWGGLSAAYGGKKSAFVSWGFNMYPDSLWQSCGANPLAYRWAKHYVNYDKAAVKPPGWRVNDSTQYDPTRSWDGWGRFNFSPAVAVDSNSCRVPITEWDIDAWTTPCRASTQILVSDGKGGARLRQGGATDRASVRDVLGRIGEHGRSVLVFPWESVQNAGRADRGSAPPF